MSERADLPDLAKLSPEQLRALIVSQHELIVSRDSELEQLKLLIAKLRRMQFGRKSEKLDRQIEQLELQLEALQLNDAEKVAALPEPMAVAVTRSSRKPLPAQLPREVRTYLPKPEACPDCGGELRKLGEDASEVLERIPAHFLVIRHVRVKLTCTSCERIVQAAAPSRPIERGMAGPGLLAHVLVSKFSDHLPLYRQSEIYAREGVELDRSTLADWVGASARLLEPLGEVLRRHVMSAAKLHADDTPVPVLAPGLGKTKTGRLWTYVRDDRPAGDETPPAVWFAYTPDRKGEHPKVHLREFRGMLQADAYAGFEQIYEAGSIREAACWAHVRRKFYDLQVAHKSPVAEEALRRIGALYAIEADIRGRKPEERRQVRNERSRSLLESLKQWVGRNFGEAFQKIGYRAGGWGDWLGVNGPTPTLRSE
jgi:transposase